MSFLSSLGLESLWERCKATFAPMSHSHDGYATGDDLETLTGRNLIVRSQSGKGYCYGTDGNAMLFEGTACMWTAIPVTAGDRYTFSRKAGGGDYFRFIWLDSSYAFKGRKAITEIASGTAGTYIWTVPEGAAYMKVSFPWDAASEAKVERGSIATEWAYAPEDVTDIITRLSAIESA